MAGLARDFQRMRFEFIRSRGRGARGKGDPIEQIEQWSGRHAAEIDQFRRMIARAQAAAPLTPPMLAQIASQARNLLQR